MKSKAKPLPVVLIALYSGFFGLVSLPAGCMAGALSGLGGSVGHITSLIGLLCTAVGVLLLACAFGLWTLQPWGRQLAWWLYVASIVVGVLSMLPGPLFPGERPGSSNVTLGVIGIVIDILVLTYLSRAKVRAIYGR